jgi:hypothetical protein
MFKTGDIVRGRVKSNPFIFHVGIIVEEPDGVYIWHNSPDYENSNGGNILKTPIDEWLKERTVTYVVHTGIEKEYIEDVAQNLSDQKYTTFGNNCETFINQIRYGFKYSPQSAWWIFAIGTVSIMAIGLIIYLRNRE